MTWRDELRAAVATTGPDFATYLRGQPATGAWEHADTPELTGLEAWARALAERDRMAGIGALVVAAQHGFPIASAAGGEELENMGFRAEDGEQLEDGAAVEVQIRRARSWLDAPTEAVTGEVSRAFDRTRQLMAWDDDLRPADEVAFYWYLEVGQCCCAAILGDRGDPSGDSYYDWPAPTAVGRGLVLAVRGLRMPGTDLGTLLADLRAALVA